MQLLPSQYLKAGDDKANNPGRLSDISGKLTLREKRIKFDTTINGCKAGGVLDIESVEFVLSHTSAFIPFKKTKKKSQKPRHKEPDERGGKHKVIHCHHSPQIRCFPSNMSQMIIFLNPPSFFSDSFGT